MNSKLLSVKEKVNLLVKALDGAEKTNEALSNLRSGKSLGRTVLMTPAGQQAMMI